MHLLLLQAPSSRGFSCPLAQLSLPWAEVLCGGPQIFQASYNECGSLGRAGGTVRQQVWLLQQLLEITRGTSRSHRALGATHRQAQHNWALTDPNKGTPPVDQEVCAEIVIPTRLWVGPHYEGDIQPCVRGGGQVLPWGSSFYLIFFKCRQHEILNIEMLGESQDLYFFIVLSKICSWNVAWNVDPCF